MGPNGPTVTGRYILYDKIAVGGMATVHLGRLLGPIGFSRTVAIKRLLPQFVADLGFVSMFVDEARLASRIRHPNVVPTLDVVTQEDELFLVLEYVHGETLSQLIKATKLGGGRIPPSVAASIVCGMLHGLHAAHNVKNERGKPLGLVHRDVSPQNVLVGADGVARLLDFGVAKAAGRMQVTTNGEVKGKLAYMAPEQIKGTVTPQSDIYSAAAVLWEALTCQRLFQDITWTNIAQTILTRAITPPREFVPDLPPELDAVVMRGLQKHAQERFASAREMALAIERCLPIAPAHEVGEWVEETAKATLLERAQKIAELEGHTSLSKLAASMSLVEKTDQRVTSIVDASEFDTRVENSRPFGSTELTVTEEATEVSPGTALTQVSTVNTIEKRRSFRLAGVTVGIACLGLLIGVLLRRSALQAPAAMPQVIVNTPVQPPARSVLPPPGPPLPGPTALEPASDLSSAAPPTKGTSAPTASKRGRCNPPYTVDENKIRRIKPYCI
ncbi:MAG TPA: serine/threonine-protein kinase [Polyangiaceae bacterium]